MKKVIINTIGEILLMVIVVVFSIPVWEVLAARLPDTNQIQAHSGSKLRMALIKAFDLELSQTFEPGIILIRNHTNENTTGKLLFAYDKSSTLPYQKIIVKINEQTMPLNTILVDENDQNYLFELMEITLAKYTSEEYEISLWIHDLKPGFKDLYFNYELSVN